jgi:hypothetical protein
MFKAQSLKQLQDLAKIDRVAKVGLNTKGLIIRDGVILKPKDHIEDMISE